MNKSLLLIVLYFIGASVSAQTNAPSIQTGVTFQWSDTQTVSTDPATIQSVTVNSIVYLNYGVPAGYTLTQLGPNGHGSNNIRFNGGYTETTSASASWNASALASFQDLNLNHYFEANGNGRNICDNYTSESTTDAQRQTLTYGTGIIASTSGVIAVTERNANNCYHVELFGIPAGGGAEQSLGETFVNQTSTKWGFGGTGTSGNIGTPGALNPPVAGSDYWLSDRVVENRGTIGIALFYLDDIAPTGSLITKAQLTASTSDHADGKLFILTLPDVDNDGFSDVDDLDDDNDGIKDIDECGGIDPSADDDTDGTPNYQDPDFCTLNASGFCANLDADFDGIPNHLDLDSDNDGITDVVESGGTDANNDGLADGVEGTTPTTFGIPGSSGTGTTPVNTDGTGNSDFMDIDADDDGIPDNIESQPTTGYSAPSGTIDTTTGIYSNYGTSLSLTDTDGDGTPDYLDLDSDNDGVPDIEENDMANSIITYSDFDGDGLDDIFEGSNTNDPADVNDEINNPSASVLPDTDGDLASGGDLDYRDLFNVNPPSSATLNFDGVDDYVEVASVINGLSEYTVSLWFKYDGPTLGTNDDVFVMGQKDVFEISIKNWSSAHNPTNNSMNSMVFYDNSTFLSVASGWKFNRSDWTNITVVVRQNGAKVESRIFKDGYASSSWGSLTGTLSNNSEPLRLGIVSGVNDFDYNFKGWMDEVRVFDKVLTDDQIQRMVYQEIENNSGKVQGTVTPKDIVDASTDTTIPWANLLAYYPMTDIINSTTSDFSSYSNTANLYNITSVLPQTAPMPFVTMNDGDWTQENTWLHGEVWNIENLPLYSPTSQSPEAWSIVNIKNDVTTSSSHKGIGLIIDSDKTLTVQSDNQVENSWFLELNGALDLKDDSQLIQTINSDLVTSATGKIKRRQEGASSAYWYNYWASPVGSTEVTTLADNNVATNNANNTDFSLNMIRDHSGVNCNFTSAYTASGNISTYWLYTFKNGITYWDWTQISTSTGLNPGIGYTQKGTGVGGSEQQYIFEGKPNNGTILVNVTDTGGSGSVANVSKTNYLLGNPYPSAIDIHNFIDDNMAVIDGTLQLWQQWSGSSHNLNEYNGGYAQVNKLGYTKAYQFQGREGANTGSQNGTIVPTRYLPVGQGFITEIKADGNIEFNNSQRVFIKEADADGTYNNGSVFSKSSTSKSSKNKESKESGTSSVMQKIRIEFNSVSGPSARRELLSGFSDYTTDAYDYGYDAENSDVTTNDLHLNLDGRDFNIQAYAPLTNDKIVTLNFKSSGSNAFNIKITELVEIDETQEIYLKDNLTGTYFDLTEGTAYDFSSDQGVFNDRFEIVFQSEQQSLSTEEGLVAANIMYYKHNTNTFYAKNLNSAVKNLVLINMRGQYIMELQNVSTTNLENGIRFDNMATGTYVVCLKTDTNEVITKKIVIN